MMAHVTTASRPSALAPATRRLLAPPVRAAKPQGGGGLSGQLDAAAEALTRVIFSPTSRDNAAVSAGAVGFAGRLPARHGAARRPFAGDAGVYSNSNKRVEAASGGPVGSAAASMSSADEEDAWGGMGGLERVFGGQAGQSVGKRGAPTTGAGWAGEGAHRRQRRPGTGGGF
jgi:hypothetical protein